jgi:dTDP-4-amino-4,6-dideoxygalactose transaminase
MSAAAQTILREYAAVKWPTINHKGRMAKLAKALGFGHRRVRAVYQNEPGISLRADELQAITALRRQEEANALEQSQANYRLLEARLAALEELYSRIDPEHTGEHMAAYRAQARGQG